MLGSNRRSLYTILILLIALIALAMLKREEDSMSMSAVNDGAPEIQTWQTEKGARVLFVPTQQLPMVDIRLVFNAGSARDDGKPGLARLVNTLLDKGAGDWNANQIAERFENVGARYSASALRDMAVVGLRSLKDPSLLEEALSTLTTVLQKPRFISDELELEKQRTLVAIENQKQSPDNISDRLFYKNVFSGHPYSTPVIGTEKSISEIQDADILEFYQRYYVAKNAVVAMVGALTRDEAEKIANHLVDGLDAGKTAEALPAIHTTEKKTVTQEYPSTQTHIRIGMPGMRRGDKDFFPLYVGNHILGGSGFGSRIVEEIREKRGLAYSSYSYFLPMQQDGPFMIGMQTRSDQTGEALKILNQTLKTFLADGPNADELEHAKKNITGGFPLKLDSNKDIVEYLGMIGFYNLPLDYLKTFNRKVEAVTLEQIKQAFQQRVKPDELVTVIVGKQVDQDKPAPADQS